MMALGGVLHAGQAAAGRLWPAPRALTVQVARDATDALVQQQVDEAILLQEAAAAGWSRTDPIIVRHLTERLAFLDPEQSRADLLAQAFALGLDRTDPVARQRVLDRARRALGEPVPQPTDAELAAHLAAYPTRFQMPARVRFAHVVLVPSAHEGTLEADLAALRAQLPEGPLTAGVVAPLGDRLLGRTPIELAVPDKVGSRFEPVLGEALATLPEGVWSDPIATGYGVHLVQVMERLPEQTPPLDVVRGAVRADWRRMQREALAAERLGALRAAWDVTVVRP